jgi:signal transduction histidine kinase
VRVRRSLQSVWPFTPGWAARLLWAVLSIPLAMLYAALFAGLITAVVFAVQGIGVVLFVVLLATARGLGGVERRLASRLLAVEPLGEDPLRRQRLDLLRQLRVLLVSSSTWRVVAWLAVRVPYGAAVMATVVLSGGLVAALLASGWWTTWTFLPLLSLLAAIVLATLVALELQVRVATHVARRLLGTDPEQQVAELRQTSQRLADRNRLARDLHDTIGHSLTASLLQATAARRTLAPGPDGEAPVDVHFARQALEHIETNTRAALGELDRALAVLRDGSASDAPTDDDAPTLTSLHGLLAGLRDGGLPVAMHAAVPLEDVAPESSRLGYRVVQEGTTNVLRHAGCPPTTVSVDRTGEAVTVSVRNGPPTDSRSRPGPGGGRGLTGLRDRAAALGGGLSAGPTADGGYELRATLPVGGKR